MPPKKQSRFWGSDGPNEFISSMSVLVDWLTTADNYSKWRGGDKHSGVTKKTLASGIGLLIKDKVGVTRTSKDVQNKIESIERDFRGASDWLGQTGAGLESGAIKEHIDRICPLYYQLEDVMKDRATTKPLFALGTALDDSDTGDESTSSEESVSKNNSVVPNSIDAKLSRGERKSDKRLPTESVKESPSKRIKSLQKSSPASSRTMSYSEINDPEKMLFDLKKMEMDNEEKYKKEEVEFKKKEFNLRMSELEDKKAERLSNINLSDARTRKCDAEAETARIVAKATLLRERKKLLEEGHSKEDIDMILPLK